MTQRVSPKQRVKLWTGAGLRLRLVGWRRRVYTASRLYLGLFILLIMSGKIPGPVMGALYAGAVCAGLAVALILFGPAPVAAPIADADETSELQSRRRRAALLAMWLGVLASVVALALVVDPIFWAVVAGAVITVIQDVWQRTAWGQRYARLGPDQPIFRSMWETRPGAPAPRDLPPRPDRRE